MNAQRRVFITVAPSSRKTKRSESVFLLVYGAKFAAIRDSHHQRADRVGAVINAEGALHKSTKSGAATLAKTHVT